MKPVSMKNTKAQLLEAVQQRDAYILRQAKELEQMRLRCSINTVQPARPLPGVKRYMKQGELWEKIPIGYNTYTNRRVVS